MLAGSGGGYVNTHRAADDVVLVRVPTNVSDARVMATQFGDHGPRQHVINCKDRQDECIHAPPKHKLNRPRGSHDEVQRERGDQRVTAR